MVYTPSVNRENKSMIITIHVKKDEFKYNTIRQMLKNSNRIMKIFLKKQKEYLKHERLI